MTAEDSRFQTGDPMPDEEQAVREAYRRMTGDPAVQALQSSAAELHDAMIRQLEDEIARGFGLPAPVVDGSPSTTFFYFEWPGAENGKAAHP